VEERLRNALDLKAKYDTWGMGNMVISWRIKVRLTEEIIDLA